MTDESAPRGGRVPNRSRGGDAEKKRYQRGRGHAAMIKYENVDYQRGEWTELGIAELGGVGRTKKVQKGKSQISAMDRRRGRG